LIYESCPHYLGTLVKDWKCVILYYILDYVIILKLTLLLRDGDTYIHI
jgi:hypothetical protein